MGVYNYHHYWGTSIYKTKEGKKIVLNHYDQALKNLKIKFKSKYIQTIFGKTHILICGPKHAPPLIFIPPRNIINPIALQLFKPLTEKFRIYAPDIIGLPGKSDETRLNTLGDKYGKWITEIIDNLKLKEVSILGSSFGAFIILQTIAFSPKKIEKIALINPVGITKIPKTTLVFRLWAKYLFYYFNPTTKNLLKAINPHFSSPPNKSWINSFKIIFQNVKISLEAPNPISKTDLKKYQGSSLIVASKKDPLYHLNKLIKESENIFSKPPQLKILEKSKHMPSKKDVDEINKLLIKFFTHGQK